MGAQQSTGSDHATKINWQRPRHSNKPVTTHNNQPAPTSSTQQPTGNNDNTEAINRQRRKLRDAQQ
jgi:hypothetical protein